MGAFDDIPLEWDGVTYTIPANRVLGAVARIEDIITLHELGEYSARGTAPMGKLAKAYGAVLRYAGADLSDEDVYLGMFSGGVSPEAMMVAINGLVGIMVPPAEQVAQTQEKKVRRGRRRGKGSSKKRSKPSQATDGSGRLNSGT